MPSPQRIDTRAPSPAPTWDHRSGQRGCSCDAPVFVPTDECGGLAASYRGNTVAVGEGTLATAAITLHVVNRGRLSFAYGTADLVAAAAGTGEGAGAYASCDGGFEAVGADIALTGTRRAGEASADGSRAVETVSHSFIAIEIAGLAPVGGPLSQHAETTGCLPGGAPTISGSLAEFATNVAASGDDSFAQVDVVAITSETGFASVDAAAVVAVDAGTGSNVVGTRGDDRIVAVRGDALVDGGRGDDVILTGTGDDFVLGGRGRDSIRAGEGDNTVLGGDGRDTIVTGGGDDWILGGDDADTITPGGGRNLVDGGDGSDRIMGGDGDDTIRGGDGDDWIKTGGGDNVVVMGGRHDDGDDTVALGLGRDTLAIVDEFGVDVIERLKIAEGDRIAVDLADGPASSWDLAALNGTLLTVSRGASDTRDLVLSFEGELDSTLILDNFFAHNLDRAAGVRKGVLPDAYAVPILRELLVDLDSARDEGTWARDLQVVDLLSLLG